MPGNVVYKVCLQHTSELDFQQMLIVQGSKDVVEFLVMNSTVVDVEGKRDTKKVIMKCQ